MRRRRSSVRPLRGQLLFADLSAGSITLDCMLGTQECATTAIPVTLTAKIPEQSRAYEPAVELLQRWAAEMTLIEMHISDGRSGPQVELATTTGRVVLESYEDDPV
jgi:hypothetical protein